MAANNITSNNEIGHISASTFLKGDLYSEQDIRIDGQFIGNICSKGHVFVGDQAIIEGEIVCADLDILGKVKGNVYAKDTLTLKASSRVSGDMSFNRIQIEIGAEFVGACTKIQEEVFNQKVEASIPDVFRNGVRG